MTRTVGERSRRDRCDGSLYERREKRERRQAAGAGRRDRRSLATDAADGEQDLQKQREAIAPSLLSLGDKPTTRNGRRPTTSGTMAIRASERDVVSEWLWSAKSLPIRLRLAMRTADGRRHGYPSQHRQVLPLLWLQTTGRRGCPRRPGQRAHARCAAMGLRRSDGQAARRWSARTARRSRTLSSGRRRSMTTARALRTCERRISR